MDSSTTTSPSQAFQREPLDFIDLSRRVLHVAHRGAARIEFLREVSRMMLEFSGCETIELRLTHGDLRYRWQAKMQPEWFDFQLLAPSGGAASVAPSGEGRACWYDSLVDAMIRGESPSPIGGSTRRGLARAARAVQSADAHDHREEHRILRGRGPDDRAGRE
jgi:hypothetical protein